MKGLVNGQASKFLVAVMGAIVTGLGTYYGSEKWTPIVTTVVTALMVYLVPNTTKQ